MLTDTPGPGWGQRCDCRRAPSGCPGRLRVLLSVAQGRHGGYIAATWGWDEQVQREFHARAFTPGRWQIITLGGTGIGMIDVEYRPGEIYLARIEIHRDHQGCGTGTRLIGALIDEAGRNGQDVVLDVLAVNRRARVLYRRLGMREEAARHGEGGIKIRMRFTGQSR